jgi:competence protein ComEA
VRDGRGRVRGERARIAERVRALLADGPATGPGRADDAAPSGHPGRASQPVPWLPGDDFTVSAPSIAPRPASVLVPESAPSERASSARLGARLAARLPARIDPGRRGAIAVAATAVVAAVVTGAWVFSSRPHSVRVTATGGGGAAMASVHSQPAPGPPRPAGPSAAPSSAVVLVIDVAGKVRHPGLYRLPAGSRIDDAVQAAGGALPGVDLTALNLAAKVTDGQQIAVGMPGAAPAAGADPGAGSAGSTPTSAPVDLNSATLDQLETLPGVGPVLGQHILDWRAAHGPFVTIDQLREVSGIGDVKFAGLRARVTV